MCSHSMAATPCAATPCAATPCAATPCAATPCAATPCAATPRAATPCAATPCAATPCAATPCAATPCAATPCATTPEPLEEVKEKRTRPQNVIATLQAVFRSFSDPPKIAKLSGIALEELNGTLDATEDVTFVEAIKHLKARIAD
eukprot:Em0018g484a